MRAGNTQGLRIDRAAVEDAMSPNDSLLRDHWFIWSLLVTGLLGGLAFVIDVLHWRLLLAASALMAAMFAIGYVTRFVRRHRRRTHLMRFGRRHPALSMRGVTVLWVQRDMASIYRWAIVADWIDASGQSRSSLSGPYDYDPQPLLDGVAATVMADPADASNAMLLPQGLPPPRHAALNAAQRREAPSARGLSRLAMIVLIAFALLLALLGGLLLLPSGGMRQSGIDPATTETRT